MMAHDDEPLTAADVVAHYGELRDEGARPFLLQLDGALVGDADLRNIEDAHRRVRHHDRRARDPGARARHPFALMLHAVRFRRSASSASTSRSSRQRGLAAAVREARLPARRQPGGARAHRRGDRRHDVSRAGRRSTGPASTTARRSGLRATAPHDPRPRPPGSRAAAETSGSLRSAPNYSIAIRVALTTG